MIYLCIGIAGFIGALLRYFVGIGVGKLFPTHFPLPTLIINIVGCFVLAWFTTKISKRFKMSSYIVTGIGTGLIGSFTTFSTFSVETVQLVLNHHVWESFLYVMLSVCGGLAAAFIGMKAVKPNVE